MLRKTFCLLIPQMIALIGWSTATVAQEYPAKLVRIVTLAPGGGSDVVARLVASMLSEGLGQQVIVENRGAIASEIVAKASADGYTLLVEGSPLWILPLFRPVSWDAVRDFAPIALAVSTDDLAAAKLENPGPRVTAKLPAEPVWLTVPGAYLRSRELLPMSVRVTLSGITTADKVTFTVAEAGQGIELRMQASCRSLDEARILSSQLRSSTSQLKDAVAMGGTTVDDLVKSLAGGNFDQTEKLVSGAWPLPRTLLQTLTSGI